MAKPRQTYESDDIIVTFDADVCIHSGVCVRGLPDVFLQFVRKQKTD